MKTLVVCSGGLDSITLAYKVAKEFDLCALVSFDYGQRHQKELGFAAKCADHFGVPHHIVDITAVGALLGGSALTDTINVPDGHYAEDNMKITVVPNRNAIMLTIAYGMACSMKADQVATAVHAGDHLIYPDCRPDFINTFENMQKFALEGVRDIALYTPFLTQTKDDIVSQGAKIGVDFEQTWSCYKGREIHCGRCGTCVERLEAFHLANVFDPTLYEDPDYWLEAISQAKRRA